MEDNVKKCRERLYKYWNSEYKKKCKKDYSEETCNSAKFILSRNIICGNALSLKCVDNECKDIEKPIVFSEWTLPFNDYRMQRKDYTFDELLNENTAEINLLSENEREGKFLKQYISHYKNLREEEDKDE